MAALENKYHFAAWYYDLLDYPWERHYRHWRPRLLAPLKGKVLELGVGTGRNFRHYTDQVEVTGIDISSTMLKVARWRKRRAKCQIQLLNADATQLEELGDAQFDWVVSSFLCCLLPAEQQEKVIAEVVRVLKPYGRLRLLGIIYSQDAKQRRSQQRFARLAELLYGARFDRHTLATVQAEPQLELIGTRYLQSDTYQLIEAMKLGF